MEIIETENKTVLDSNLLLENQILKDKIKNLEEKLKQNGDQSDLNKLKETFELLRIDRKRLKCEKLELLNHTKDLYKTIESKEKQIKEILKSFDLKSKETRQTVKRLIDSKLELEKDKSTLQTQVVDLLDEKNYLRLKLDSKSAQISKLEKQLEEFKTCKSPNRNSLDKDSDYGYSSSKSRDTLSSSMIETNQTNQTNQKPLPQSTQKQKNLKKEERSIKCKSNDSYIYIKNSQLNDASLSSINHTSKSSTNHKMKQKFKFSTLNKSSSYYNYTNKSCQIKTSKSNNNLSFILSTSDYETDLNKVLDSDEFIDLDDNNQSQLNNQSKTNDTSIKNDQKSTTSSSSSSVSFSNRTTNLKNLEISSSTTIASVSPSCSLTSSSASSYKHDSKINSDKPKNLNISAESNSEECNSDTSPLLMSQSITICEEDNMLNKTSNDVTNMSRYSVKQPLSMSMSMHTPSSNIKSRSSRIINTIIRMSTIGSSLSQSSTSNSINRSSTVIESQKNFVTLTSSRVQNDSRLNNPTTPFVSSKSSYCVRESDEFDLTPKNLLNKSFKYIDLEQTIDESKTVDKWDLSEVKIWLENLGMLPAQIKNALKCFKNGKNLLNLNDSELEKVFLIANPMHKRKLRLAIDDLKHPEKCKYKSLGEINTDWIINVWLKQIGLVYLQNIFKQNLVDGRLLANLQKKDLDKYFGISKKTHQTSIMLAIDLLKKYDFDVKKLNSLRELASKENNQTLDICLWTNENFVEWLKLVNLNAYLPQLSESGIHGALVADSSFNVDYLYNCLGVEDEPKYQNMKKILEDEIKLLKKSKFNTKTDTVFNRPLSSFKSDKQRMFTFRGSLGRALGKKIKRDISSPLIDDDTFKRIEYNHKIIDVKSTTTNN